jgi:hypothetical protein
MPSAITLTRYFGDMERSQVEHLSAVLGQSVFGQLKRLPLSARRRLVFDGIRALWLPAG